MAAQEQNAERRYTMCRSGATVRTIRIFKPKGSEQCRVTYTKDGVDHNEGGAKSDAVCDDIVKRIQQSLEKHNWKCKDVTLVKVHEGEGDEDGAATSESKSKVDSSR